MWVLIFLILTLILFGAGFALKALWWVALILAFVTIISWLSNRGGGPPMG